MTMRKEKKHYLKQKADKKVLRLHYILQALILIMFLIVLYDAFKHHIPLYYICFFLLGSFVGRVLSVTDKVKHSSEVGKYTLETNLYGVAITLILLSFRFFWGRYVLDFVHVLWTTDALYLLFIGIYRSKWRNMVRQADEIIYGWFSKREGSYDEKRK
jgi:F0F1-type ATP synthase assembly protein I